MLRSPTFPSSHRRARDRYAAAAAAAGDAVVVSWSGPVRDAATAHYGPSSRPPQQPYAARSSRPD